VFVLAVAGRAKFALLLALLPATATVIGATVLLQTPTPAELFGIGLVMPALLIGGDPMPVEQGAAGRSTGLIEFTHDEASAR